ncbi:MAG: helix-turn-helix domain-containing protein [Solirubrobacterales bacterium]
MSPLEPQNPALGKAIKSLREEAGLTQEELALASGLSTGEISRQEHGWRNPGWRTMKRVAKGLGVTCAYMAARAERLEREEEDEREGEP